MAGIQWGNQLVDDQMKLQVMIGNIDWTGMLVPGTLRIPDRINERSEATFSLKRLGSATFRPNQGDAVKITLNGTTLFRGFVWDPEEERLVEDATRNELLFTVRCVDNHLLADRRLAARTYDNQTAGAIVSDLIPQYLAGDGVTAGTIQAGPTITRAVFNYVPVSQALDELAELAGYVWYIDFDKKLYFLDRSTVTAPWPVTNSTKIRGVKIRRHREEYRNRQYIRAGQDLTDSRTESFVGDGTRRTFTTAFPVAKVPTGVTVNAVSKTIGIRGVDSGKDFYWQKGSNEITQDDGATALTSSQTLAVTYQGLFPIVVSAEDPAEILARKTAESTAGIYEAVDENANIDDSDAALEIASAKLARYAKLSLVVTFNTDTSGLEAGQLVTVTLPTFNLDGQFLIEEVTFEDFGAGHLDRFRYHVKAIDGSAVGGWVQFFKRLASQGKSFVIRDNEVLVKLKRLDDGVKLSDTLTYTKAAPVKTLGSMVLGYSELG